MANQKGNDQNNGAAARDINKLIVKINSGRQVVI